jgi:hypothetical protein
MTFKQACADLEDAAKQLGAKGNTSSMSQMAWDVVPALQEFSPQEYEQYCAEASIPLYSSSPADPPANLMQAKRPAPSMAAAQLSAQGLPGMEALAATSAEHPQAAGHGSTAPFLGQLSMVSISWELFLGMVRPYAAMCSHNQALCIPVHVKCVVACRTIQAWQLRLRMWCFVQTYDDDDAIEKYEAAAERDELAAARQLQAAQEFAQHHQVRSTLA